MSHRLHIYTTVEDYGTDGKKMRLIQLCSLVEQIPTIPKILVLAAVEDPKKKCPKMLPCVCVDCIPEDDNPTGSTRKMKNEWLTPEISGDLSDLIDTQESARGAKKKMVNPQKYREACLCSSSFYDDSTFWV